MSSGLPSLLGNAQQPISFSGNPFNHFGYLFGQQTGQQASVNQSPNSTASTSSSTSSSSTSNRFKVKRHRQRVDAGEPRNTYQAKRAVDPMVQIENLWLQQTKKMQEEQEKKQVDEVDEEQTQSDDNEEKLFENIKQESTECEEDNQDAKSIKNEDDADYSINVTESTTISRESPSSTSSSSKRKSFQPQKINEHVDDEQQVEEKPDNINCAIQQQLNANPQLPANIFEAQKKLYAAFIEQQRKMITLKTELFDNLTASIEKVYNAPRIVKDWATSELNRQETAGTAAQPFFASPMAQFMPNTIGNGIFPPVPQIAFNQLQAFNALRRNLEEEGQPKRKRAKLSDAKERTSPMSAPASPPVNRYFPPTMVAHPMYKAFGDREVSPTNSEEMSDCGPHNAFDTAASYTLTPMHLRKAKLMFFYTRYPNSNLLKSYFPDIMFNKNNTAQLVKWFSNFREFYYIQMEKFARQLIAEGVKSRDEIFVTKESELFKALNTHYNRNNHIQAPDRLVFVVQETLREFFDAIRLGKDAEPSWKKTIYKIINRMDDPIPEYFKDPNFLDRLES